MQDVSSDNLSEKKYLGSKNRMDSKVLFPKLTKYMQQNRKYPNSEGEQISIYISNLHHLKAQPPLPDISFLFTAFLDSYEHHNKWGTSNILQE